MIQRQAQAILPSASSLSRIFAARRSACGIRWRDAAVFIKGGDQILVFLKAAAVANLRDRVRVSRSRVRVYLAAPASDTL